MLTKTRARILGVFAVLLCLALALGGVHAENAKTYLLDVEDGVLLLEGNRYVLDAEEEKPIMLYTYGEYTLLAVKTDMGELTLRIKEGITLEISERALALVAEPGEVPDAQIESQGAEAEETKTEKSSSGKSTSSQSEEQKVNNPYGIYVDPSGQSFGIAPGERTYYGMGDQDRIALKHREEYVLNRMEVLRAKEILTNEQKAELADLEKEMEELYKKLY